MNEITETQGKKAFENHQYLLELNRQAGIAIIETGRLLKEIRDEEQFKALGYDTFTSYVVNSELGFSRRTAYYRIEIYEWYVEKLAYKAQDLAEIGQDKLLRVLPIIRKEYLKLGDTKARIRTDELITEAHKLRLVDFEKKYRDDQKQDGHEGYLAPPEYVRCDKCGKWRVIVPIDDCCPDWLQEFKKTVKKKNENT